MISVEAIPFFEHLPEGAKTWAVENQAMALYGSVALVVLVAFSVLVLLVENGYTESWFALFSINSRIKDTGNQAALYTSMHEEGGGSMKERAARNQEMVNQYYDLATDFYLFGWGDCFHFAPRYKGETHRQSLLRHEFYLAGQLGVVPGDEVLDVGCGVGGPARNIARHTGTKVTGITLNKYQVERGTEMNEAAGLGKDAVDDASVELVQGDFFNMPFEDEHFDGAYAIEATCHAADRVACYAEVFRVLKPGAVFSGYEWCMTPHYDPKNEEHRSIKSGIEIGDGLPDILSQEEVIDALTAAGFTVEYYEDVALRGHDPWYGIFLPRLQLESLKTHPVSVFLTNIIVRVLETLWIAPEGTTLIHNHLIRGLETLRAGGIHDIFTPSFFFRAIKPDKKSSSSSTAKKSSAGTSTPKKAPASKRSTTPKSTTKKSSSTTKRSTTPKSTKKSPASKRSTTPKSTTKKSSSTTKRSTTPKSTKKTPTSKRSTTPKSSRAKSSTRR